MCLKVFAVKSSMICALPSRGGTSVTATYAGKGWCKMNYENRTLLVGRCHLIPLNLEIEPEDGWFNLLKNLFDKINALDVEDLKIFQIKQKFGMLCVYFETRDEKKREEINSLLSDAIVKSFETCELCGAPGIVRFKGTFQVMVKCLECEIKEQPLK